MNHDIKQNNYYDQKSKRKSKIINSNTNILEFQLSILFIGVVKTYKTFDFLT